MKKNTLILATLALVLVLGAGIGTSMAFFTTYTDAAGGYPLQYSTETVEWMSQWTKHVGITNTSDSGAVLVRAKAEWADGLTVEISGDGWRDGEDGWWYYDKALERNEKTSDINILIDNVPPDVKDGDSFHVVVTTECTPATANPNWNRIVATTKQ